MYVLLHCCSAVLYVLLHCCSAVCSEGLVGGWVEVHCVVRGGWVGCCVIIFVLQNLHTEDDTFTTVRTAALSYCPVIILFF